MVYLLGQLVLGTDLAVALLLTLAIGFGLASVGAAGGLRTAFGMLNAVMVTKFILLAVFLKILLGEPADTNLYSPLTTSLVMAAGFLGLWLAMVLKRFLPALKCPLVPAMQSTSTYLGFALVVVVLSYGGFFIGALPGLGGEGLRAGGILGTARILSAFRGVAIVPVMFYVWRSGSRYFLSHPLVLGVLLLGLALGLFSTGKQEAMEPLVFFGVVAAMRWGVFNWKAVVLGLAVVLYYA
jgi:hypothetical protein